jgi:hypothetical protein
VRSRLFFWLSSRLGGRMIFGHAAPPGWPAPFGCWWACGPNGVRLVHALDFVDADVPAGTLVHVPRQGWLSIESLRAAY